MSIQVSGKYKEKLLDQLEKWPSAAFICVQASPWEHHFGRDNYLPVAELDATGIVKIAGEKDFLKLALALPVHQWDALPAFLLSSFTSYLDLMLD